MVAPRVNCTLRGSICQEATRTDAGAKAQVVPAVRYMDTTACHFVGGGVLQWSAAEQMPLGYDVPFPVIPSQSADWRGNPSPQKRKTDCRVATLLAMTAWRCRADGIPSRRAGPACPAEKCVPGGGTHGSRPTGAYPPKKQRGTLLECRVISSSAGHHASSSLSSSSPAVSTMTSAPASASPSRPRKPQLTPIIGSPAFRAVATSTSLSPT